MSDRLLRLPSSLRSFVMILSLCGWCLVALVATVLSPFLFIGWVAKNVLTHD